EAERLVEASALAEVPGGHKGAHGEGGGGELIGSHTFLPLVVPAGHSRAITLRAKSSIIRYCWSNGGMKLMPVRPSRSSSRIWSTISSGWPAMQKRRIISGVTKRASSGSRWL